MRTIYFDMDGTIADLYGVKGWLDYIINKDSTPYEIAKPLVKLNVLARLLNKLQREGFKIGIISWLAKNSNENYDNLVTNAKLNWLSNHLASVNFDEIHIVPYGTPKENFSSGADILFDDEIQNRENWIGSAFSENSILDTLKSL